MWLQQAGDRSDAASRATRTRTVQRVRAGSRTTAELTHGTDFVTAL